MSVLQYSCIGSCSQKMLCTLQIALSEVAALLVCVLYHPSHQILSHGPDYMYADWQNMKFRRKMVYWAKLCHFKKY